MMRRRSFLVSRLTWLLAAAVATRTSHALFFAPPHETYHDFESVHAMRRRLNTTYNYEPEHLLDESCRHLTERQCQREDEWVGHAKARRHGRRLNPSQGEFTVLVLTIRFPEDADKPLADQAYWNELLNGVESPTEINPAGSIAEFAYYQSFRKYKVNFVFDEEMWVVAPQSMSDYSGGEAGKLGAAEMQNVFKWRLEELDAAGFDWSPFDKDEDGFLDHLVILHSGYPAEIGTLGCEPSDPNNRIWSQATPSAPGENGWRSSQSGAGIALGGFILGSAINSFGACDNPAAKMGVIAHEYMHGFAIRDIYDQDRDAPPITIGGVGSYDIMSNTYGWTRDPSTPGIMSTFTRSESIDWMQPVPITQDGIYILQPLEISALAYKINANFPTDDEYLIVELRQPLKWDLPFPGGAGIVIFHVDGKASWQRSRGYPGSDGWPAEHYRISVLQADGNYDIEKGQNLGDASDFWTEGMVLDSATDTWPNTASIQGGVITETGLKITIMSAPGFIMSFKVEGIGNGGGGDTNNPAPALNNSTSLQQPNDFGGAAAPIGTSLRGAPGHEDPGTTSTTIAWLLSMLASASVMVGVVLIFF